MKDRVPTHPGRVRLTHVSDDLYDMRMADDPTEYGTPLSKATLLKDSTAAKYGFSVSNNPTPDDIFNAAFDFVPTIQLKNVWTSYRTERFPAQSLSNAGTELAGGTIGTYALFAGVSSASIGIADAYNASLTRTEATKLSESRSMLACANAGSYLIFAGGYSGSSPSAVADAYDSTLTRRIAPQLSVARHSLAGATVANMAVFAGGATTGDRSSIDATVDAYGGTLTRYTITPLNQARADLAAVSTGSLAIFAGGGSNSSNSNMVESYDHNMTQNVLTQLSVARKRLAGAKSGYNILFGGGYVEAGSSASMATTVVDVYDDSLTRTTTTPLSEARFDLAAASTGSLAIFAGGYKPVDMSFVSSAVVEAYDVLLTRSILTEFNTPRRDAASAKIGSIALFAGGYDSDTGSSSDVDAYMMAYGLDITIPPWSKYFIGDLTAQERFTRDSKHINALSTIPFNGYIKRSFSLSGEI